MSRSGLDALYHLAELVPDLLSLTEHLLARILTSLPELADFSSQRLLEHRELLDVGM